jgi:hypothetical protein
LTRSRCEAGIPPSRRLSDSADTVAGGAKPIDKHHVVNHAKGWWNHSPNVLKASLELKQPAALKTMKMMMMGLSADLIARWRARYLHRHQPAFIREGLYCAIDGRHPQSSHLLLRKLQDFVGPEWTISALEDLPDFMALLRVPAESLR